MVISKSAAGLAIEATDVLMAVVALQETGGETAVLGRSVYKAYGKRTSDVSVLRNLDIHVPQEAM